MVKFLFFLFFAQSGWSLTLNDLNFPWLKNRGSEEQNIIYLLNILETSPTGKVLLRDAKARAGLKGKTLIDIIGVGENSVADTTILRRFEKDNALEVIYESVSKVYINRHLSTLDALLDLAHELTHYAQREDFNPYINQFTLNSFIEKTIEGKGGEVEAYLTECKIKTELFGDLKTPATTCDEIAKKNKDEVRELTSKYFYHLGPFFHNFKTLIERQQNENVTKTFPRVSKEPVKFYSSAHSVPYPVAAIYEYQAIVGSACKNDKKRLKLIQSSLRKPSSNLSEKLYEILQKSFDKRCKRFLQ